MPKLTLRVRAEVAGRSVPGFPLEKTLDLGATGQPHGFTYRQQNDTTQPFMPPSGGVNPLQAFVLQPDREIMVRLVDQADGGVSTLVNPPTRGVVVKRGGLYGIVGCNLALGEQKNIMIGNESGKTVEIKGFTAG